MKDHCSWLGCCQNSFYSYDKKEKVFHSTLRFSIYEVCSTVIEYESMFNQSLKNAIVHFINYLQLPTYYLVENRVLLPERNAATTNYL